MASTESVILLNGCFWGTEYALRDLPVQTEAGYAGGASSEAPTYYSLDRSGHSEAVRVAFDPAAISIEDILSITARKSAGDPSPPSNPRYRRGVLCEDEAQADRVRRFLDGHGYRFDVEVGALFHAAEPYHQRYYERKLAD